jgi:hypothetical protein
MRLLRCLARRFGDGSLLPLVLLGALVAFEACTIAPRIIKTRPLPFDTYRDVAYARSILNGQGVLRDPTIAGQPAWYSPLNPLFFAGLSQVTGVDVFKLYSYSPLFINSFTPLLFYALVYLLLGHWPAFTAALLIPCLPWLKTHFLTMGMPSIHAVPLVLIVCIAAVAFSRRGLDTRRGIALGLLMGIALLHHSLSGMIVYASVSLMLALQLLPKRADRRLLPTAWAIALPILLAAPYLLPNLMRPKLNPAPLDFIAPDFSSLDYTIFIPTRLSCLFFWGFLAVGMVALRRRIREPGVQLVFCLLFVTAGGQLPGYARLLAMARPDTFGFLRGLPSLLPHEFQWFCQLFALVPVAAGIAWCGRRALGPRHRVADVALPLLLLVPGYADVPKAQMVNLVLHLVEKPPYIAWIEANTPRNAVIATSHAWDSYRAVQPFTGRKILCHYPAHMNFNVDVTARLEAKGRRLYHADPGEVEQIVTTFDLQYLVLDKKLMPAARLDFFQSNFAVGYEDHQFAVYRLQRPDTEAPNRR